jgi:hypothetical protein
VVVLGEVVVFAAPDSSFFAGVVVFAAPDSGFFAASTGLSPFGAVAEAGLGAGEVPSNARLHAVNSGATSVCQQGVWHVKRHTQTQLCSFKL